MNKKLLFLFLFLILCLSFVSAVTTEKEKVGEEQGYTKYIWYAVTALIAYILLIIVFGVIIHYSGVGQVFQIIGQVFHTFVSFVRTFFQVMVNAAPKFIRILFFVILFWLVAPLIYNLTIGLPVVCLNDKSDDGVQVYRGDIFQGMVYSLLPTDSGVGDNQVDKGPVDSDDANFVSVIGATTVQLSVDGFYVNRGGKTYWLIPDDYAGVYANDAEGMFKGFPFCISYDSDTNKNYVTSDRWGLVSGSQCLYEFAYIAVMDKDDQFKLIMDNLSHMGAVKNYSKIAVIINRKAPVLSSKWKAAEAVECNGTNRRLTIGTTGTLGTTSSLCVDNIGYGDDYSSYRELEVVVGRPTFWGLFYSYNSVNVKVGARLDGADVSGAGVVLCSAVNPEKCYTKKSDDYYKGNLFTKETFVNTTWDKMSFGSNDLITYECNQCIDGKTTRNSTNLCRVKDNERLLVMGFDIFNLQYMLIVMFIALLIWIISKRNK